MQTEQENGPLPIHYFPAHLLGIAEDANSAPINNTAPPQSQPLAIEMPPDPIGPTRGAVYSLPMALVMWAIIIAAILHFLSM
jgi:hypothetical protein